MTIRRRNLLVTATAAIATADSLPAPAIAQGIKELKLVTGYPKDTPAGMFAERLAQSITAASVGHLKVTVYPAGSLVRAFEVFDAVGAGIVDMYHSLNYFFGNKSPALNFFAAVPYGLTADELCSWVLFGGGQALWDEVDAQFNIKPPLMARNTGVQVGGWFNKEVNSPEDFRGLRYRMPGLGAEVLRRMGATVVTTPAGEIATALKSGAIDASEYVGPWQDIAMGLDKVADYYYYPGLHEPGAGVTLGINKTLGDGFTPSERAIIETAAHAEVTRSLAKASAENVRWLKILRADERIKILRFSDQLIKTFGKLSKEVLADVAAKDPLTRKVYDSYMAFLAGVMDWGELSETGYRDTRRLALS
jgi:TRAP-type mannitol/chloroaromatic compound transport system substrate-binding protein